MNQVTLGDLGEFKNGVNFKRDRMGRGVPLINVKDITGSHRIDPSALDLVDVEPSDDLVATDRDIFFVRSSVKLDGIALVGMIMSNELSAIHCGFVIRFRPTSPLVSPGYLIYLLLSPEFRARLKGLSGGAAIVNISQSNLKTLKVPLPSIEVQRRIADILSTYDDLIENNRRRMALLEDAARQLYREWFVRLHFPGHEHTRITNGVPEGWERKSISEMTVFLSRGIAPDYDEDAEGLVINQKCVRNGRLDVTAARHQSREFKPDLQVQPGDVLVNSTGEGTLGRVAQVLMAIANCTVDTHVTIVRPKPDLGIHYFGLAVLEWEPRFSTMGRGATNQTELSRGQIGTAGMLVPSHALFLQFEEVATPIFRQIVTLTEQNKELRAARDLLLPRLMSGEVVV